MTDPGSVHRAATRLTAHGSESLDEIVAEERAVALVYNGISHAVMMATPCDLEDFARGFSLTERIVEKAAEIYDIDVEEVEIGSAQVLRRMRARALGAEERPFEVSTQNPCCRSVVRCGSSALADRGEGESGQLGRRGDQCGLIPEDPCPRELDTQPLDVVTGRVEKVDSAEAVDLQIDEARNRDPRPATGQSNRNDRPVLDLDIAPHERSVDDGCGNPELHPYSLRPRLKRCPPHW